MAKPETNSWQALSPYLDQVLELNEVDRTAWLASIRQQNPALAADLEGLLREYRVLQEEQFLEQSPTPLTVNATVAGQSIGAYTLLEAIGQGGMGSVWLAERSDGRFERRAAVKFLNIALAGRGGEDRFKREGTILARLAHPHIAQLTDAGVSSTGQPYLVLEHVSGDHIDRFCDPDLALEVGTAYMRVGRVQGVPISPNLGQTESAEQNLRIAERLIGSVLKRLPANRIAFLRTAQIAHDRMVLAESRRPDTEALPLAFESEKWLEKYLSTGPVDDSEKVQVVVVGMNVANWYIRKERMDDGLRLIRRTIEIARATNQPAQAGAVQIVVARALRSAGDLEGALEAIREGVSLMDPAGPPGSSYSLTLTTQAEILGEDNAISLGRSQEAVEYFERAFTIEANFAKKDPNDADSRFAVADNGIKLAGILHHSDPRRAIALYDEAMRALAEIKNNSRARRAEVRALAGSTYPLRQIGNSAEARKRLDAAFSRLSELKLYPAEQVEPGSEADNAVRALAEFEAERGDARRGLEIYEELLAKIMASNPTPERHLDAATDMSNIYRAMAQLHRRSGQSSLASGIESRRLALWKHWDRKLPNNSFVRRQIAAK